MFLSDSQRSIARSSADSPAPFRAPLDILYGMTLSINSRWHIPKSELELTFNRSSGPGGQNVNKVNSKATLRWNPRRNTTLPVELIDRFVARYRSRLTTEGDLLIHSQRFRDQPKNIDDCFEKLRLMVLEVEIPPKPRKPVRISKAAKARRLDSKRHTSAKKQGRSTPQDD